MTRSGYWGRAWGAIAALTMVVASLVFFSPSSFAVLTCGQDCGGGGGITPTVTLSVQYGVGGALTEANSVYPSPSSDLSFAKLTVTVQGTSAAGDPTGTFALTYIGSVNADVEAPSDCQNISLSDGPGSDESSGTCDVTIDDFAPHIRSNPQTAGSGQPGEYESCAHQSDSST